MSRNPHRLDIGILTCMSKIQDMERRVELLEHFSNQQSILVDTLGSIMEELKKQERQLGITREISQKDIKTGLFIIMVMPRHFVRRMVMRAPIVSYKHQQQADLTYAGAQANLNYLVYQGGAPGAAATVSSVPAGNKVYGINVSVNFIHASGTGSTRINWMLSHLRSGQTVDGDFGITDASNWSNIGLSKVRNQVVKSFVAVAGTEDAGGKIWNMRIKIPKMWQRVREGDELTVTFNATDTGTLIIATRFKSFS